MKQTTKTQNLKNPVTLNSFQGLAHGKISREISKDKLLLRRWPIFTSGKMLKRVQHDKFSRGLTRNEKHDMKVRKCAFTLAETLIALAVIGIVAALTIPGIVKNYNQKAWGHAQDVFARKLDVALKEMNTNDTLTGYRTTAAFVNELKKNIKITKICTGSQITNCFADEVVWNEGEDPIEVTTSSVEFTEIKGYDWAEPIGIQFSNGVNAIIGYNKNCYSDPYNNQYSPLSTCIGIMYDVSGFKKPNANGKDIASNSNVAIHGCVFKFTYKSDTVCFTKIFAPGEYEPLTNADCTSGKYAGKYETDYECYSKDDYWAGAQLACGGKKENMVSYEQLRLLANYLYGTEDYPTTCTARCTQEKVLTNRLGPFYEYYVNNHNDWCGHFFSVWANIENDNVAADGVNIFGCALNRFHYDETRYMDDRFAVCVK